MALLAEFAEEFGGILRSVFWHYLIRQPVLEIKRPEATMAPEDFAGLTAIISGHFVWILTSNK